MNSKARPDVLVTSSAMLILCRNNNGSSLTPASTAIGLWAAHPISCVLPAFVSAFEGGETRSPAKSSLAVTSFPRLDTEYATTIFTSKTQRLCPVEASWAANIFGTKGISWSHAPSQLISRQIGSAHRSIFGDVPPTTARPTTKSRLLRSIGLHLKNASANVTRLSNHLQIIPPFIARGTSGIARRRIEHAQGPMFAAVEVA
jgi:hypothetical protein